MVIKAQGYHDIHRSEFKGRVEETEDTLSNRVLLLLGRVLVLLWSDRFLPGGNRHEG